MGFCLSVKRRVFAHPLVSLTGHTYSALPLRVFVTPAKKLSLSTLVFKRLPKQNASLCKKKLAMGC